MRVKSGGGHTSPPPLYYIIYYIIAHASKDTTTWVHRDRTDTDGAICLEALLNHFEQGVALHLLE